MITRNPSVGRHNIGAPIAKSGTKPAARTGSASGKVVGTGVNKKTGQRPEYKAGMAQNNDGGQSQIDQWNRQPPEPFRNSQPSANPRSYSTGPSAKVGGVGGKTGATGPTRGRVAGSAGIGSQPTSNFPAAATGPKGGLGQENGKVIGKAQPRRVGNVYNQPRGSSAGGFKGRGGAPSFYGR